MLVQETSLDAYYNCVVPKITETQQEILQIIKEAGNTGMTAYEVELKGYSRSAAGSRIADLKKMGLVKHNGEYGLTSSGCRAMKIVAI